jgi:hypothetical protein
MMLHRITQELDNVNILPCLLLDLNAYKTYLKAKSLLHAL